MDNFNVQVNSQPKKSFSLPKIIFIILGVALVAEVIYAGRGLLNFPSATPPLANKTSSQAVAKISLDAPQTKFQVNETVPVSVNIDTGSRTISGVDLIIQYDPEILEATKQGLVAGSILDEYPLMSVDSEKGLISISGISSLGSGFTGTGKFALINFKAKNAGSTPLTVSFEKNTTTASNLVESNTSKNILEEVDNLEITIE